MAGWRHEAKTSGGMRDSKRLFWTLLFRTTDFHYGRLDDHVPAAVREMSRGGNRRPDLHKPGIIFKQEHSSRSRFLERGVILHMHKSFNEKIAYRKITIISPGLIFVQKPFFAGLRDCAIIIWRGGLGNQRGGGHRGKSTIERGGVGCKF